MGEDSPCKHLKVYGQSQFASSYRLREVLSRQVVHYEWIELSNDADCQKYLHLPQLENVRLPVIELPDGSKMFDPTERELAARLGCIAQARLKEYDLAIYGAGPAGLSAAVYAAADGLNVVLIERHSVGGQAGSSALIENYLGFPDGLSGADLAERARQQAVKFGVELLLLREGVKAEFKDKKCYGIFSDGTKLGSKTAICACGLEYRRLGIPNEERLWNKGVMYGGGASEAPYCKNEEVFVVGGGNGAGQGVLHFSKFAAKVYMIVRGDSLSPTLSHYLVDRIKSTPNIEVLYNHTVTALEGDEWLSKIQVTNSRDGKTKEFQAKHLFICIGGVPQTQYFENTPVIRDEVGYVVTGPDLIVNQKLPSVWPLERHPYFLETSYPGLFAVGDVRHGSVKRCASAAGEGAMAVAFVHRFLEEISKA